MKANKKIYDMAITTTRDKAKKHIKINIGFTLKTSSKYERVKKTTRLSEKRGLL
jgi:hypothetical protein